MRAYIHKLQSKPVETRKKILAGSLAVSMVFVGAVWIYGLGYRFNNQPTAQNTTPAGLGPFALFSQSVAGAYQNISASVGSISFNKNNNTKQKVDTQGERQIDVIPVEPEQ